MINMLIENLDCGWEMISRQLFNCVNLRPVTDFDKTLADIDLGQGLRAVPVISRS
jgi:hypothetical protein